MEFVIWRGKRVGRAVPVLRAGAVLGLAGVAAAVIWSGAAAWAWPASLGRPNILLVSIDTLRPDHLHCYGYERETSPNIDALAAEGARFALAVSPTSWTLPSHVTLLTGIPPSHHGVINDGKKLSPSTTTLAEVLRRAGYRTAGIVSGRYLHPTYGYRKGFESYDFSILDSFPPVTSNTSQEIERLAREKLAEWREDGQRRPFFLFLHMFDPHYDFVPPDPYKRMFDPDYEGPVDGWNFYGGDIYNKDMDPRDFQHLMALYDGEIRYTDHHLGSLIDHLRSTGELDRTIVVVTADHGEEFFEHGKKGHRETLFDEVIRVPLVVRYPPRIPRGVVVDRQVRLMDIGWTILSLAGVEPPDEFGAPVEGEGLRPHDLSRWMERRPGLPHIPAFGDLHGGVNSLRTERRKLVYQKYEKVIELFDLEEDPLEQSNVEPQRPDEAEALRQRVERFLESKSRTRPADEHRPDEEHLKKLRELGYIN